MTDHFLLLESAINLIQAGDRLKGRELLIQVINQEETNELAWLWLVAVSDDLEDIKVAFENVLEINPFNEQAQLGIYWVQEQIALRQNKESVTQPVIFSPQIVALDEEFASVEASADTTKETLVPVEKSQSTTAIEIILKCYNCRSEVNNLETLCWKCKAIIHCCMNCIYNREVECKKAIGIWGPAASAQKNNCHYWSPEILEEK